MTAGLVVGGPLDGQVRQKPLYGKNILSGDTVYTFRRIRNRINESESVDLCLWVPSDTETYQALFRIAGRYVKREIA